MCFAPVAIFFDMTDARSCDSMSRFRSRSTWMILSSEGASPREPPHARQAFLLLTIFMIFFNGSSTFEIVSITSAVPEAEVIAREEVFGRVSPTDAQIATVIGVVLFPATPPMQCLFAVYFPLNFNLAPVFTIAFVKEIISSKFIPLSFSAAVKNAISELVRLLCTISDIIISSSFWERDSPFIFFLIRKDASDVSETVTSTLSPVFTFKTLFNSWEIPISLFFTSFEKMSTTA